MDLQEKSLEMLQKGEGRRPNPINLSKYTKIETHTEKRDQNKQATINKETLKVH